MAGLSIDGAHSIRCDDIVIEWERWRLPKKEGIEELAQDFVVRGQLQPIIVRPREDGKFTLFDGLHRLLAAKANGSETIAAVFNHELDPIEKRAIELEANCKRFDMGWQERELARAELHRLRMERDPSWTQNVPHRQLALVRHE